MSIQRCMAALFLFFLHFSVQTAAQQNLPRTSPVRVARNMGIATDLPQAIPFSFHLANSGRTSAGVFTTDGVLVRTLWSGTSLGAGSHTESWDGRNDDGLLAPDGSYEVRVLYNDVRYTWEGKIGNTSEANTGSTVHRSFQGIHSMAIAGSTVYYSTNYDEGRPSQFKFNLANPQSRQEVGHIGHGQGTPFVATDGQMVYWGGYDALNAASTFVFATKTSDDSEVSFTNGVPVQTTWGRLYPSSIAVANHPDAKITGLAVQKNGPFLFISRKRMNQVQVLNKTTGALVQNISLSAPGELAIDAQDQLWLIQAQSVSKFAVATDGSFSSPLVVVSGLVDPLALGVSPDNSTLIVADGGSSQQLKAFSNSNGSYLWVYGQLGGYINQPEVRNDKFYFTDNHPMVNNSFKTYICFEPDGSFWVGDGGNYRAQHFTAGLQFIDRLMYFPHNYSVEAVKNDPSRVFGEYLEFSIDYSLPLSPGNNSWQLVRNWRASIPSQFYQDFMVNIFRSAIKMNNGRTYALLEDISTHRFNVLELPASGPVRLTGTALGVFGNERIHEDGSIRRFRLTQLNEPAFWYSMPLSGFDGSGNPQWGPETILSSIPAVKGEDPISWDGTLAGQVTSTGVLISFDKGTIINGHGLGYHLGGMKPGENKWLWRVARNTDLRYEGAFPPEGTFDVGNHVVYPGGDIAVLDRSVIWSYHGEFWKGSQTNKFNHIYDNGLFIGQFGTTGTEVFGQQAPAMMAGNVMSFSLVKDANGDLYLYHNDEGHHSGMHRWKISGMNTISEQVIPVSLSSNHHGLRGEYHNGPDLNNFYMVTERLDPQVQFNSAPVGTQITNTDSFSVRWKGFVIPVVSGNYSFYTGVEKGVRLWVNGKRVTDHWGNGSLAEFTSSPVYLEAGKRTAIRMEINGGNHTSLSWSAPGISKQVIPAANLLPTNDAEEEGVDLLEGLDYYYVLQNGLYGWTRGPANEDQTNLYGQWWNVKTGYQTYDPFRSADVYVNFRNASGTYHVSRDLGDHDSLLLWKLSGNMNWFSNEENTSEGGMYLEVLDADQKIITRFHTTILYGADNTVSIYANNQLLVQGPATTIQNILRVSQPIEITMIDYEATFRYGPYAPLSVNVVDPQSNWRAPKTMRLQFWSNGSYRERTVDIERMRFYTVPLNELLPTQFLQLSAARELNKVLVQWETNCPLSTHHFVIERSEDGNHFSPIGSVSAVDHSGNCRFQFPDTSPPTSETYYRIRQVAADSSFSYSQVVSVHGILGGLRIYPNPARDKVWIEHPAGGVLRVFAADGRLIKSMVQDERVSQYILSVQNLAPGSYFLKYQKNNFTQVKAFVIN